MAIDWTDSSYRFPSQLESLAEPWNRLAEDEEAAMFRSELSGDAGDDDDLEDELAVAVSSSPTVG